MQKRAEQERQAALAAANAKKDQGPKVMVAQPSKKKAPSKAAAAAEAARQRREAKKLAQTEAEAMANQKSPDQMT